MTSFLDGPAAREMLMLWRAPIFLRVVENRRAKTNTWDALDQLDDEPKPHEVLYCYRLVKDTGWTHIRAGRGCSGIYRNATYRVVANQPDQDTMRSKVGWRQWCIAERAREVEAQTQAAIDTAEENHEDNERERVRRGPAHS
jgi:hypothetical protein